MAMMMANCAFPSLNVPELDHTEGSEDEDSVTAQKFACKEDQDVAVFMAIADRMAIHSLLHLLQGHARQEVTLMQYYDSLPVEKGKTDLPKPVLAPKVKKFRFAEVSGGQVRCVVHEIASIKSYKELWWGDEAMQEIRMDAIDVVKYFRKYRHKFISAVEVVAHGEEKWEVEAAMKTLTKEWHARGLEAHICSFMGQIRSDAVQAVLDEQKECQMCGDSYELTAASLSGQSLAYSKIARDLARKIAKCDHIEALKATMSKWVAEPPEARR